MLVVRVWIGLFFFCLIVAAAPYPEQDVNTTCDKEVVTTFQLFDNGASDGGVNVTMSECDFPLSSSSSSSSGHQLLPPGMAFAMEMSKKYIEVSKYNATSKQVIATRAYREDGELVTDFGQLLMMEPTADNNADDNASGSNKEGGGEKKKKQQRRVYLVADGLDFIWPFIELGHRQAVSSNVLSSPIEGNNVVLESVSELPRVFKVFNMFTDTEAMGIIDNALNLTGVNRLKRSTVGSGKEEEDGGEDDKSPREDHGRTSQNAWDHESQYAKAMITRSFQLTRIEEDAGKRDGLQVVRYEPKQGYNTHPDYFTPNDDVDFNFHPYSGGSNRFATVFLYLNDVEEGGNTVFPRAPGIGQLSDPPQYALDMFEDDSWEKTLTAQCYSKLAVPPKAGTAALFYSVTPDGQIDPSSHHGACPVIKGLKWGANIWIWNRQRYGEVRTGNPCSLLVTNTADQTVYVSWERKPSGSIQPGHSMKMNTYEYHRFKASFGSHKETAISEFTVDSDPKDQVWVIEQPPRHQVQDQQQEQWLTQEEETRGDQTWGLREPAETGGRVGVADEL